MTTCSEAGVQSPFELPVFLRGKREYVQGTQIVARAAERLEDKWRLQQAVFSEITANRLVVQFVEEIPEDCGQVGTLQFSDDVGTCWALVHKIAEPAPRREIELGVSVRQIEKPQPLSAVYVFSGATGLEGVLNAIVQGIKSLHEELAPSVHDVWFTGMRKFSLPIGLKVADGTGTVRISAMRVQRHDNQYQSLLSVNVTDSAGQGIDTGIITFAFRSDEIIDVN
jgi:hypothetical protein